MTTQRHQIQRQIFEFEVSNQEAALHLHATLAALQNEGLEDLIDRCCTEMSSPDRVHRIAKLEIDLGELRAKDLARVLPAKLVAELRNVLAAKIQKVEEEAARLGEDPATNARLELISLFARTGNLPFWADAANPQLVDETMHRLLRRDEREIAALVRWLARDPRTLARLAQHTEPERSLALFRALVHSATRMAVEARSSEIWTFLGILGTLAPKVPTTFAWVGVLQSAALRPHLADTPGEFWRDTLAHVAMALGLPYHELVTRIEWAIGKTQQNGFESLLHSIASDLVGPEQPIRQNAAKTPAADAPSSNSPGNSGNDDLHSSNYDITSPNVAANQQEVVAPNLPPAAPLALGDDPDEAYIDSAGLVLLWPFVPTLFDRLGLLLEQKKFTGENARQRAIALVHYLATGELHPPDFRLPLAKVLCGAPVDDVFDRDLDLTENEMGEATNVLVAALEHAKSLGVMEPDAFQSAFLRRRGVLSVQGGTWLVRVERAPYDAVLQHLPWALQWIRFPWMQAPLCVEWPR